MGRRARIIGTAMDIDGMEYEVREKRHTPHGFSVRIGWPTGQRGPGFGGPRVILTPELAAYLDLHRHTPASIDLPVGNGPIKRLRSIMGHHWREDREEWWEERLPDMISMTIDEFAERHCVSTGAVSKWRTKFVGPWLCSLETQAQRKHIMDAINLPVKQACAKLGLSPSHINRLRKHIN